MSSIPQTLTVDYKIFESMPGSSALVKADAPKFTIISVTNAFTEVTGIKKEDVVGKGYFDCFTASSSNAAFPGNESLRRSFEKVLDNKVVDVFEGELFNRGNQDSIIGKASVITSQPVLSDDGEVLFIIQSYTANIKNSIKTHELNGVDKAYQLFMQSPVAVCIVKGDEYVIELANEGMLQLLGRTIDIVGKPLIDALPEAKLQGLISIFDNVIISRQTYRASGFPATILINGIREDRYFDLIFKPDFNESSSSKINRVFCVANNVTEQVLARKKVEESEFRYRTLIEEATVATALYIGKELRIQHANEMMLDYWDKDHSVIGKTFREALPELDAQPFPGLLDRVYETGDPYLGFEERADIFVDQKLQTFYFNFTYKALRDMQGNIYGIHHMAIDVTQQVLARKKLEEEKERTTLALAVGELGVVEVNWKTDEVITDARCNEIFGFSGSISRKEYEACFLPDEAALRKGEFDKRGPTGLFDYEVKLFTKEGKIRWIKSKGLVYKDEQGNANRSFGIVQDITEQKKFSDALHEKVEERTADLAIANELLLKANEELSRSNTRLEEFAYAASHDMKEPVRKIQTFAQRLKLSLKEKLEAEDHKYFERLENASERLGKLIDDLLEYSHVSKGSSTAERIDLNEKVKLVLDDLELQIADKKAKIMLSPLPVVMGFRRQIQQLFQNLISNALKFTRPGVTPEIQVRAKTVTGNETPIKFIGIYSKKQYHLITVSDNGIGFPQEYAEKIFLMFQRLHGKAEYAGTGIGLSIVQKVVENHGGVIWAESEPGAGATFNILLPVDDGQ